MAANLATDCEDLSELTEGDGKAVMVWGINNIPKAVECKHKHAAIREAYNNVFGVLAEYESRYSNPE